jgi:ribonuclease R
MPSDGIQARLSSNWNSAAPDEASKPNQRPSERASVTRETTKDRPDALQIHTMLLRSMQQAIYTATNSGHFGLAYEAYTHFTSPIRRYPDLLVHRVIKALLHGKRYHIDTGKLEDAPQVRRGGKPPRPHAQEAEKWEVAGAHCSANERRADEASRDVEAWLKCRFMRDRLGEEFTGTVTAATTFGLFVQLDELFVEGLLHITELGGEYFRFDEARQELRGERTGIRYAIGSRVRVQVSRVDLDGRRIDFRLVREGEELLARAMKEKGLVHEGPIRGAAEGVPVKASLKRARKAEAARERAPKSPIHELKAAVKKAAAKSKGRKSRRKP